MALTRIQNTCFTAIDDFITGKFVLVGVVVTATAAPGSVAIHDEASATPAAGTKMMSLSVATNNDTKFFDFSDTPVRFETAISLDVTNADVTIIFKETGK